MLKQALKLRAAQQLTMTPHLQQAIRLLLLPIADLHAEIQHALDENVMLEAEQPDAEVTAEPEQPADPFEAAAEAAADDDSMGEWTETAGPGDAPVNPAPEGLFDYADHSDETLKGHLLWQLELENLDARTTAIGQAVIDAINDDGYMTDDTVAIQATLAPDVVADEDEVEAAIQLVQRLDPAGVGARSVSESVLLQLAQLDPSTPCLVLARTVAAGHLELVAERQTNELKRQLQASEAEVEEALLLVRACHPRPGAAIYAPAAEYSIPDVFVRRSDNKWIVELNASVTPFLRVNQSYAGSLGRDERFSVLRAQLQEAKWLVRSLEIRNETLLKVAEAIVERQTGFLDHGEEFMRPMVLRDIAEAIGMHESTVSRVTANKHMHTPRGIIEFRYFFSSHVDGDDGELSSTAVRAMIRRLIVGEVAEKPLSDNQISNILAKDGIKVARRTVAKYRDSMNIPTSTERKRTRTVQEWKRA